MNSLRVDVLIRDALVDPAVVLSWSLADWDLCLRQAARGDVLPLLAARCREAGRFDEIPQAPRHHLRSAEVLISKHQRDIEHELECIHEALAPLDVPVVLLKGAAYLCAGFEFARTRMFSDVDILVPHSALSAVESALFRKGWVSAPLDTYDQSYYREFMHELPPMVNTLRGMTIDVHHTILPPTARARPDPSTLIESAVPCCESFLVLAPVDMLLHSATHLFHEGEFNHGFRGLLDLQALFLQFADRPGFQQQLDARAEAFGLTKAVRYARRYVQRFFGDGPRGETEAATLMDLLFDRGLVPDHSSCDDELSRLARFALFVRGHYLRMPLGLLLPHLARKAVKRLRAAESDR